MRPRWARRIARLYGGAELCGFFTPGNFKKMAQVKCTGFIVHFDGDPTVEYCSDTPLWAESLEERSKNINAEIAHLGAHHMEDEYKGLDFGSYCTIEMFRHVADNEFYQHKVIGRLKSNTAVSVPIRYGIGATGHDEVIGKEVVPCLKVVCCGVDERQIFKVRVSDVIPA